MRGFGYPFKEEPWSRHASLQLTDYDVVPGKFTAYRKYGACTTPTPPTSPPPIPVERQDLHHDRVAHGDFLS
jgi:hypothetical protein